MRAARLLGFVEAHHPGDKHFVKRRAATRRSDVGGVTRRARRRCGSGPHGRGCADEVLVQVCAMCIGLPSFFQSLAKPMVEAAK